MKILILNQSGIDLSSDTAKAKEFYKPYIDVEYTIQNIKTIPIEMVVARHVPGFDKETGKPTTVKYMALSGESRYRIQQMNLTGYDQIVFAYNIDKLKFKSDEVPTSWTESLPIMPNCIFIQMTVSQYFKDKDSQWKTLTHENTHAFCYISNQFKKIAVVDEMDATIVNGQIIPFYKNDDPFAKDGNYAHTLKNLKPFFDSFKEVLTPIQRTLRLTSPMTRGEDVKELQTILKIKSDGVFGPATKKAVIEFQKSNGLIADGVVGPRTWETLKKKA